MTLPSNLFMDQGQLCPTVGCRTENLRSGTERTCRSPASSVRKYSRTLRSAGLRSLQVPKVSLYRYLAKR